MSEISERIEATILLADYVNSDAAGKLNIIGGGIRFIGVDPDTQATGPFGLLVLLNSPLSGDSPAVEILLTTATGQVLSLPGLDGKNQPLRISQNVDFAEPAVPGMAIPKGTVPSTVQIAINFANGLPLKAGYSYQFRVQIDHDTVATYSFFTPRPPQGAVIG